MIDEKMFSLLLEKAEGREYSSELYSDFDEDNDIDVLVDDDKHLLFIDRRETQSTVHFATSDFEALLGEIAKIKGRLRMNFVPRKYAAALGRLGFTEFAEYADLWNNDLKSTAGHIGDVGEIVFLSADECGEASDLSHRCRLQSRGFEGETKEWFMEWLEENKVIAVHSDGMLVGFCCVSIYNNGTILWVREIAVDPAYQGRGFGKQLMTQAISYGAGNAAVRGFLAADVLNRTALGLYHSFGYAEKSDGDRELQMIRE